jgi:hypothetical protein
MGLWVGVGAFGNEPITGFAMNVDFLVGNFGARTRQAEVDRTLFEMSPQVSKIPNWLIGI